VGNAITSRHFEGEAEVDGRSGYYYWVDVADNGDPGRLDTFRMQLSDGYEDDGNLQGGNIKLHKPCE
jgi:hypothetical protein